MSTVNPTDQVSRVRFYLGKTSSSNVSDDEIDDALTNADGMVLEQVGFNTLSDPAYDKPLVIEHLKVLHATADLLIGFADKIELRESLLKEIRTIIKTILAPSDLDEDEGIITGMDYETYPLNPNGTYWSGVKQREIRRTGNTADNTFVTWGLW